MSIEATEVNTRMLVAADGTLLDRVVGYETEYAINLVSSKPVSSFEGGLITIDSNRLRQANNRCLTQDFADAGAVESEQFYDTGERFYLDVGCHPEYATGEEIDFKAAADRLLAGHVKTARFYKALEAKLLANQGGRAAWPIQSVNLYANTSQGGYSTESWASHENLLARRELELSAYVGPLATHRACRIVWAGAGMPIVDTHGAYQYLLSEKAPFIWDIASGATTRGRPLVNTRDEPLANPAKYRRIHNITGEGNFSPLAIAMRAAIDSVILRACEVGEAFDDLRLENPIVSIRSIAADLTLKQTVRLESGRSITAIDLEAAIIQRALTRAQAGSNITPQEIYYAERCLTLLGALATDPMSCGQQVDWVVKRKLIDKELSVYPRKNNESDVAIAVYKAAEYSRLLPKEGYAMRLLRKGYFEDSPTQQTLDNGLPLPPTRARLRGEALAILKKKGLSASSYDRRRSNSWESIAVGEWGARFPMFDPYESDTSRFSKFLNELDINPNIEAAI